MMSAVSRARLLALSQRTTVYMVFVPTNFWNDPGFNASLTPPTWNTNDLHTLTNLLDKQLIGYAYVELTSIGDQPGQHIARYLSGWKTLPEGTFIPQEEFLPRVLDPHNASLSAPWSQPLATPY